MKKTILIVDDDPVSVMIINNFIKKEFKDIDTVFAEDGDDALEKILLNCIDLIITDINMPNMDGIELASIVKKSNKLKNIPIIFVTSDTEKREISYDMDIAFFISKPINKKELLVNINHVIQIIECEKAQTEEHEKKLQNQKDEMMILFTHELKTPLNAIINFSSYMNRNLKKEITPRRVEKFLELSDSIRKNGTILLSEITDLLDVSKIKNNKMTYEFISLDLSQYVDEIVSDYKTLYDKKVDTAIDNVGIISDKAAIWHLVGNLYSNALKYSKSKVFIELKKDKNNFIFTIEDDGFGIKKENKEKIFEMFEQDDKNILTREKEGTGIGLYLVKLLCNDLDYSIQLQESEKLGGAKFILTGDINGTGN